MANEIYSLIIESPENEVFNIDGFALTGKQFATTIFIETPEDLCDEARERIGEQFGALSKKTGLTYVMIPEKYRIYACKLGEVVDRSVATHRN